MPEIIESAIGKICFSPHPLNKRAALRVPKDLLLFLLPQTMRFQSF